MTIHVDTTSGERLLAQVPELRMGAAVGAIAVAGVALHEASAGASASLALLALLVAGLGTTLPTRLLVLLPVTAWGFLTGFVVNTGGLLTFGGADLAHALVLTLAATVATTARPVSRARPRSLPAPPGRAAARTSRR